MLERSRIWYCPVLRLSSTRTFSRERVQPSWLNLDVYSVRSLRFSS